MSFFRSDTVSHFKLAIPRESAWQIMSRLGQSKIVHMVPSAASVFSKPFSAQSKRCEETASKLRFLECLMRDKLMIDPITEFPQRAYEEFYRMCREKSDAHHGETLFDEVERAVDENWKQQMEMVTRADILEEKILACRERSAVIRSAEICFQEAIYQKGRSAGVQMKHMCGVIGIQDELRINKSIFRITQGNSIVKFTQFKEMYQNLLPREEAKIIVLVAFPCTAEGYFQQKMKKILQIFCGKIYELPKTKEEGERQLKSLQSTFLQAESLLHLSEKEAKENLQHLSSKMNVSAYFRQHQFWKLYVLKEKELYARLNEMEVYSTFLKGQMYVRDTDVPRLSYVMSEIEKECKLPVGQLLPQEESKLPTYFVTNAYTTSAMLIVETYGVPRYKEVNPAFFTTITFPFLFGVMFGDIAHGLILFLFGSFLCFSESASSHSMLKGLHPHRYLFTLMGFFAIFCGFIYNDFLSISLNLFGSCYNIANKQAGVGLFRITKQCVYPIGLDPVWSVAQNNLNFVNSLKMKIAVIIGVTHMILGVCMKAANAIHFKKMLDLFFQFIPQLLFLVLLFGYMDYLIILKWLTPWPYFASNAPSIITTMINLPLKLGHTDVCCGGQPLWGQINNTSQDSYQKIFLYIALICIPTMLLPKPIIEIMCHKQQHYKQIEKRDEIESQMMLVPSKEEHDGGEIMVHQLIETIQYALGCISNTASYLRLWALSLAHSQLSEVFFTKTVEKSLCAGLSGIPGMLIGFVLLAGITIGVLLCMDTMECFLHTLRLHWVQFQNKFYKGDGIGFKFYSFTDAIAQDIVKE